MHKRHIFAIIYGLVLTAFTVYVLLDTFVITRVYTEVSTLTASSLTSGAEVGTESHTAESTDAANVENEDPRAGISETISGSAEGSEEVSAGAEGSSAGSAEGAGGDAAGNLAGTDEDAADSGSGGKTDSVSAASESHNSRKHSKGSSGSSGRPGSSSGGQQKSAGGSSAATGTAGAANSNAAANGTAGAANSNTAAADSSSADNSSAAADSSSVTGSTGSTGTAGGSSAASQPISTQTSYQDENITITLKEYTVSDTTVYVADVQVASADLLKTALAQNAYGRNVTQKTSEMAENAGAILAINGDYYGAQETGYVLRNGVLYRASAARNQEDLVIYEDGSFSIINESEVAAEDLLADGAVQILSFGPALVVDGEIAVSAGEEVGKAMASNPRTGIGFISEGHYVFVVSDGRTDESEGLSLSELAAFMQGLGVETAYNLDGGGSSTMYFNGEVVNNPTTNGNSIKERSVSDIVYIGY